MRSAVFVAPGHLEIEHSDQPTVGPRDLLLRVEACGVCGSDVASYVHGHYVVPGQVLGHEMSAIVETVGAAVANRESFPVGTRVAVRPARACEDCAYCDENRPGLCGESGARTLGYGVRGGFAEWVLINEVALRTDVIAVPPDLAPDEVLWAEPLAVAVHSVRRAGISPRDRVAVMGGGSVGLCVAAAALALGTQSVVVFEPREVRRQAALTIGAEVSDPGSWAGSADFDVVIDTSGSAQALDSSTSLLKVGGRLVLVGLGGSEIPWPLGPFDVSTSFAYDDSDFAAAVDLIVSGRVRLGHLLTHTFSLDETGAAIEASANDASVIKAAVKPDCRP